MPALEHVTEVLMLKRIFTTIPFWSWAQRTWHHMVPKRAGKGQFKIIHFHYMFSIFKRHARFHDDFDNFRAFRPLSQWRMVGRYEKIHPGWDHQTERLGKQNQGSRGRMTIQKQTFKINILTWCGVEPCPGLPRPGHPGRDRHGPWDAGTDPGVWRGGHVNGVERGTTGLYNHIN